MGSETKGDGRRDDRRTSPVRQRFAPEDRERQIVEGAIAHFTTFGFGGSTRDLAKEIGVTQPLLYRYFPNKQALIERVYEEVYQWNPAWPEMIRNHALPLQARLTAFYRDYANTILRREWVRMFVFAGLGQTDLNSRYLDSLRTMIFVPVMREVRTAHGLGDPATRAEEDRDIELIWNLHAGIFYIGMRKWVYGLDVTDDLLGLVDTQVLAFLNGVPAMLDGGGPPGGPPETALPPQ